ncbi:MULTISPECIES: hypothetical protein [Stenotrophomonas]|uniref:hypothetical protein n=1 Tax=Stenotrophomonas TaxID=40323 RepID=UPI000ACE80D0|nr:hypothetical protein [Stenotrophomonas indicatrix]
MGSAAPQSCSDSPLLPRLAAWLAVLLVHLLMLWWLLHAGRIALIAHDNSRISLRWLPPEAPPMSRLVVDASRPAAAPHQVPHAPALPTAQAEQRSAHVDRQRSAAARNQPLNLRLPAGSIDGGDGITAEGVAAKLIGRREVHAAFAPRRPPFRIHRQMTPEQILQGVAQMLGTWPPGYMVDPCTLGQQDMHYFQNAVEEVDRQLLREAVLQVSASCR